MITMMIDDDNDDYNEDNNDNNEDGNDDELQCVPQYYHGGFPQCL